MLIQKDNMPQRDRVTIKNSRDKRINLQNKFKTEEELQKEYTRN